MINGLTRSDDSPSDIRITQGLAETTVEIANATKHLNEAIAVGDSTVVLRDVAHGVPGGPPPGTIFLGSTMKPSDFIHGQEVGIVLQIVPKDSQTSAGARTLMFSHNNEVTMIGPGPASDAETKILVTDAGGNMVANYSLPHGTPVYSIHIVNADFQEPLKLTLTMPAPTK